MSCLTIGCNIATAEGEFPVENLAVGDRIVTRDNGIQRITGIRRRDITGSILAAKPHLHPVRLRRAALGADLPETDMLVSPNQRVLVHRNRTALYLEEREALVAAKHLVDHDSIRAIRSMGTSYFNIECRRPEIILANGVWVECFNFAASFAAQTGNAQRTEIRELFYDVIQFSESADTGAEIIQYRRRLHSI